LGSTTLSMMTFSLTILSLTTLSIITLNTKRLFSDIKALNDTQHNENAIMLNVIVLSASTYLFVNVIMLSAIRLNVFMLSVVAPNFELT
jgi:hypothetical protein